VCEATTAKKQKQRVVDGKSRPHPGFVSRRPPRRFGRARAFDLLRVVTVETAVPGAEGEEAMM